MRNDAADSLHALVMGADMTQLALATACPPPPPRHA
jgi:hypothetical protein